jgi:hypothetical protein
LASICLSSIFITLDNINLDNLLKKSNFINTNIHEIEKFIIKIINDLNYDIYRPFNIFGNNIDLNSHTYYDGIQRIFDAQATADLSFAQVLLKLGENEFTINDYKCDSYYKLSKLDKIYTQVVQNNIIEISPQYYIDKLLL